MAPPPKKNKNLKQGSLFSFFNKKPATKSGPKATAAVAATANKSTTAVVSSTNAPSPQPDHPLAQVGSRIQVYLSEDDAWYTAVVEKRRNKSSQQYYVRYVDDGQLEWLDLSTERFRTAPPAKQKKRRVIEEDDNDDDEEMELLEDDMEASDEEGSVYKEGDAGDAEDEDADEKWMVSDDDDDIEISGQCKTPNKRKAASKTTTPASSSTKKTPPKKSSSSLSQFSASKMTVTEYTASSSSQTSISGSSNKTPTLMARARPKQVTPETTPPPSFAAAASKKDGPLPFVANALNPAGSHVHNHLAFLQRPVDARGRAVDHPDYDPRTLTVRERDWQTIANKKMTNAVQQWWELKSRYFDTVLLFKTGKFYEMFHMDADIGVQHCGLTYMKGHVAHAGFPEIAYGPMADKLVRAGYKVARVEQTETLKQFDERKKKAPKGKKPKVFNREVCSVMTIGTRTFCFLDEKASVLEESSSSGVGPLLAIREIPVMAPPEQKDDQEVVLPVCEYGITLVDAVRGTVTIGQFADDAIRSRMTTLLAAYAPSEILIQGGADGASPTLKSLLQSLKESSQQNFRIEVVRSVETFPRSTALDQQIRKQLERSGNVQPWHFEQALEEVHRRGYFPRASKQQDSHGINRWPKVLKMAVEGKAELALSSFGAALFYLQRNLIDAEILSMGVVKAYIPPSSSIATEKNHEQMTTLVAENAEEENGYTPPSQDSSPFEPIQDADAMDCEAEIANMELDGTTLHNLEILTNSVNYTVAGSLWSKINYTKTPHGARLLRAWLLRPLFRKADIERRSEAVQELVSGAAASGLQQARQVLSKCGDIERLLLRVHSMSGVTSGEGHEEDRSHPSHRAVLYEGATYTKRKVGDFAKVLNGLREASQIPELFHGIDIESGLLRKIALSKEAGGCFPMIAEDLEWFFDNFDCAEAAAGRFDLNKGTDAAYDEACESIDRVMVELNSYKDDMCAELGAAARKAWKYANVQPDSKDKYLIELPASVAVPDEFIMKGKRGSGHKQINKYQTPVVQELVLELESAYEHQRERKARGMELIFAQFDSKRVLWSAVARATSMLDALGSLAQVASKPGYVRPTVLECGPSDSPCLNIVQGRHPCVENILSASEFIPNDLGLGGRENNGDQRPSVLLLSGPNMGGKSTLLRQTCLITILAQIGCFVPAERCELTPLDRIFTRLGATDRILLNQSTFFVELAETAAALRGATRRSLAIFDELGRGTSTFDGTAIASAAVGHLVQKNQCISLFATHYHSLLDEWRTVPRVMLGHMECMVQQDEEATEDDSPRITFLYTLGQGVCPKSFGINVARLAGLPESVLNKAKANSQQFEEYCSNPTSLGDTDNVEALGTIDKGTWEDLMALWEQLQTK